MCTSKPRRAPGDDVRKLIDDLGATRVMMGSNSVRNVPVELAKYRAIGLYEFQDPTDDQSDRAGCLRASRGREFLTFDDVNRAHFWSNRRAP